MKSSKDRPCYKTCERLWGKIILGKILVFSLRILYNVFMRRKTNKTEVRNIQLSGGSYYVTLPIEIVRKLGWKERQKVVIRSTAGNKIEIKDWKK